MNDTRTLTIENTGNAELSFEITDSESVALARLSSNEYPANYFTEFAKSAADTREGRPVIANCGGSDTFGYQWIDSDEPGGPIFDYIDISGTGTPVTGLTDDNQVGPFPIGFNFPFYENTYAQFYIASNGVIEFENNGISFSNQPIPAPDGYNNLIAWCWDDLYCRSDSYVYYESFGDKLVIQFVNYGEWGNIDGRVDAEVIMYPDGSIVYQYDNFSNGFDTDGSTVGIENADGTDGLGVAFNTPYLHDDLTVEFYPEEGWLSESPLSGTVAPGSSIAVNVTVNTSDLAAGDYSAEIIISNNDTDEDRVVVPVELTVEAAPHISVDPGSFYFELKQNTNGNQTLTIENAGGAELSFEITDRSNETTSDESWLSESPVSGTVASGSSIAVNVTVNTSDLHAGDYSAEIVISNNDSEDPVVVPVELTVEGVPDISVNPESFYFELQQSMIGTQTLRIENTGEGALYFRIMDSENEAMVQDLTIQIPASTGQNDEGITTASAFAADISGHETRTIELEDVRISGEPIDVLLVGADYSADSLTSILTSFPDIGTVNFFDAASGTPTLAELQQYDVAIVWSNTYYYDKVALGDVLADYVDCGGNVIIQVGSWYGPDFGLQGRIISEGYSPFVQDGVNGNHYSTASLGLYNASHSIMADVNSVSDVYRDSVVLTTGAELVAEWDDGEEFIATKGPVVGINSWPGDGHPWTGDYPIIIHNTVLWVIYNDSAPWLSESPFSATVAPGSSLTVDVAANTTDLEIGNYSAEIVISNNDPDDSPVVVPVNLTVTDFPTVTINSPAEGQEVSFVDNIVNGTVVEADFESATLVVKDGAGFVVSKYDLSLTDDSFRERVEYAPDQENTLELTAYDVAGNSYMISRTVYVKNNTVQNETPDVIEGVPVLIDAVNETDTFVKFVSDVNASDVTFTVTAITNKTDLDELNGSGQAYGEIALERIVEVNVTGGIDGSNESQVRNVRISLYYDMNDLDLNGDGVIGAGDLDENKLFVYWYNETSGNWTKLLKDNPDWVLDFGRTPINGDEPGCVWVEVEHLSIYGIAGSKIEDKVETSKSGGGSGTGSATIIPRPEKQDEKIEIEPLPGEVGEGSEELEIVEESAPGAEAAKNTSAEEQNESSPGFGSVLAASGLAVSAVCLRRRMLK
ncbi:BACON domain-containing protein [Methanosarcina sp. Mfa9]|uniref:BACON domain-containing protein n=1 Tax=Methanosarcina sp. Mfa9 TaxID=3439063 RepID=UPI003F859D23